MQCPACGFDGTECKTQDMKHTYRGQETVIPAVHGEYCPSCGEVMLSGEEARRVSAAMGEFNRRVNLEAHDPRFIRDVRKKLNLDQKEAGKIFGGGANAFSRYETGKTPPPVPLVKLLRILDSHPELLPMVR